MEMGIYVVRQIAWSKTRVITILTKKTTSRQLTKNPLVSLSLTISQTPYKHLKTLYLSNMILWLNGKLKQKNAYNKT